MSATEDSNDRFDDNPDLWYGQFENAAVQSDSEVCNDIGVSMLNKGGSAADAAIATAICIGTILNCDSGIGGGLFLKNLESVESKEPLVCFPVPDLLHLWLLTYSDDDTGEYYRLNGRETAPLAAHRDMFVKYVQ